MQELWEKILECLLLPLAQAGRYVFFADVHNSEERLEVCLEMSTAVRPKSQIYCNRLGGLLEPPELTRLQGMSHKTLPRAAQKMLRDHPALEQSFAGNSFTATVAMAKFIALLIHSESLQAALPVANKSEGFS